MRTYSARVLAVLAFGFWSGLAQAQSADVGLVNLVSGEVGFTAVGGGPGKVQAFMKVREGDRFTLAAGAQLRIVFFESARQERWAGPASLKAGKGQSEPLSGKPAEVSVLPGGTAPRMARIPDLMQNARLGGVQVRGARAPAPMTSADKLSVSDARSTYERMKKDFPADDITPELFFASALHEHLLYDQMKPVVDEMVRKQPESEDVKALASWVSARLKR